jgi:hypothetical protein
VRTPDSEGIGDVMNKAVVLFFAADPLSAPAAGGMPLQLAEDIRRIRNQVRLADYRDALVFDFRLAAQADDLIQALNETSPQVVHFSGHGTSEGLILVGRNETAQHISAKALEDLFQIFRGNIQVVVLNACFSLPQAQAIARVVGCAIGTGKVISDDAAITFGGAFYGALAFGRSVQAAFDQARVALALKHPGEEETPQIVAGPGVDPAQIFVVAGARQKEFGAGHAVPTGEDETQGIIPPAENGSQTHDPIASGNPASALPEAEPRRRRGAPLPPWLRVIALVVIVIGGAYLWSRVNDEKPESLPGDNAAATPTITDSVLLIKNQRGDSTSTQAVLPKQPQPDSPRVSVPEHGSQPTATRSHVPPPSRVQEAQSEPAPAPATGSLVERVSFRIGPDNYKDYPFTITDSRRCRLRGRVAIESGPQEIDVLVLEPDAFENFRQNLRYPRIYSIRRINDISLDVPLPRPGEYHLVISNRFSAFTSKLVLAEDVRWECNAGE